MAAAAAAFSSTTSVAAPPASTPSIFLGKKKLNRLQRSCRGRHGSRGLSSRVFASNYKQEVDESKQTDSDRWRGLAYDVSDDQQDITRGKGLVDSLFQAPMGDGTHEAVLSSYEYISQGLRDYTAWDNIKDGYYIAPAFMDKLVVHIAKNFMALPNIKVPLILGIWGGKGQGKSFQCELVFAKMGINPVVMSAGELETVYDDEVRRWVAETGVENIGRKLVNSKEGPPKFEQPKMTIAKLLEYGHMLVAEQENVKRVQLADKYLSEAALGDADDLPFYGKAAQQVGVRVPVPQGCTDPRAGNFDPTARSDDGSSVYNR